MIKVTDKMIYALCDNFPQSQRPKQSIVRIAIQSAIEASEEIQELVKCQECLKELVYLKQYKKIKGEDKFYKDAKKLAWHNAKKLMIKADVQPPKEQE